MNEIEALEVLLKPIYDQCKLPNETLQQFTEIFLTDGGEVDIKVPETLRQRVEPVIPNMPEFDNVV